MTNSADYSNEDEMFNHICFSTDRINLYSSSITGDVYIIDPLVSAPRDKPVRHLDLYDRKVSTIDEHPADVFVFLTESNDQTVKMSRGREEDCQIQTSCSPLPHSSSQFLILSFSVPVTD